MFKEVFLGRAPSHFHLNPIVKAFIISDTFVWSSWNSVTPIFAIFAANQIPGGNTEIAASVFSVHLIVRIVFELTSGKYLIQATEARKFFVTIVGILFLSLAYLGFAKTQTVGPLFLFGGLAGFALGIATPAKNSLFSTHLDKKKESLEWGIYDASAFFGMALSAALGGFIANRYGFSLLFTLAALLNLLGTLPYLLYLRTTKQHGKPA